jgi:hypothetical protein
LNEDLVVDVLELDLEALNGKDLVLGKASAWLGGGGAWLILLDFFVLCWPTERISLNQWGVIGVGFGESIILACTQNMVLKALEKLNVVPDTLDVVPLFDWEAEKSVNKVLLWTDI